MRLYFVKGQLYRPLRPRNSDLRLRYDETILPLNCTLVTPALGAARQSCCRRVVCRAGQQHRESRCFGFRRAQFSARTPLSPWQPAISSVSPSRVHWRVGVYQTQPEDEFWEDFEENEEVDVAEEDEIFVTQLTAEERASVLPFSATGAQYAYYWGSPASSLQRAAASLLAGLLSADSFPLVSVAAGLYFLWAPVALAARRAAPLRRLSIAGCWRAQVLSCERVVGLATFEPQGDPFLQRTRVRAITRLLVGDAGGARLELEVPAQASHASVQPGDAAELLVLSDDPRLRTFRAVREVFVPARGVWMAEYPFLHREAFQSLVRNLKNT